MRKLFSLGLAMLLAGTLTGCAAAEDARTGQRGGKHRDGKMCRTQKMYKIQKKPQNTEAAGREEGTENLSENRYR